MTSAYTVHVCTPTPPVVSQSLALLQVRTFLELHDLLLRLPVSEETRANWEAFL